MKRLIIAAILLCLFACHKPENLLNKPEYKAMVAHSWKSDSVFTRTDGITTASYSSAVNYKVLHFYFPHFGLVAYANGQILDSAEYFLQYEPGRIHFAPIKDSVPTLILNYADIKVVTDNRLVLERHTSADSTAPVATTYYHAQ